MMVAAPLAGTAIRLPCCVLKDPDMLISGAEPQARKDRGSEIGGTQSGSQAKFRVVSLPLLTDGLMVGEMAICLIAAVVSKFAYLDGYLHATTSLITYLGPGVLLAFIICFVSGQLGLYEPGVLLRPTLGTGPLVASISVSFLLLLSLLYLLKISDQYSRGWFLVWYASTMMATLVGRNLARMYARLLVAEHRVSERIAIYGGGGMVDQIAEQIRRSRNGLTLTGLFDDPPQGAQCEIVSHPATGLAVAQAYDPAVQGSLQDLLTQARQGLIDKVIVAIPVTDDRLSDVASKLAVLPVPILYCPEIKRVPVSVQGLASLGDLHLLVLQGRPMSDRARVMKTVLDVSLATLALIVFGPLMLVIAAAIKLDSKGPVFFRQRRNGYNGSIIHVLKFRTMNVVEDGPLIMQAERNDPRVTRVGHILRRTSLDELPQLFGVLKGEMSLVGPRPHALAHGEAYSKLLEKYALRDRVKPGLTGWAQVNGFRGATSDPELMRQRVEHDIYYIEHWSIWFDIEILLRTMFVVLRSQNAY